MSRCRAFVAIALLVSSAAGCASIATGDPTVPREPGRSGLHAPSDQVVFQVSSGGGYVPYAVAMGARPALTIYGDGRAFTLRESRTYLGAPPGLARGSVPVATLRRLAGRAARSGLFGHIDLGTPQVTDLGSTTVIFRPGTAAAQQASAYALSFRDADGGLTAIQRQWRADLRDLIKELTAAVRHPGGSEWLPASIDVTEPVSDSAASGTPRAWPGPVPERLLALHRGGGRCGVLSGAGARRVYLAARINSGTRWRVAGRVRQLIVRPLLPGERGCRA